MRFAWNAHRRDMPRSAARRQGGADASAMSATPAPVGSDITMIEQSKPRSTAGAFFVSMVASLTMKTY
jgi:hypothetical protein